MAPPQPVQFSAHRAFNPRPRGQSTWTIVTRGPAATIASARHAAQQLPRQLDLRFTGSLLTSSGQSSGALRARQQRHPSACREGRMLQGSASQRAHMGQSDKMGSADVTCRRLIDLKRAPGAPPPRQERRARSIRLPLAQQSAHAAHCRFLPAPASARAASSSARCCCSRYARAGGRRAGTMVRSMRSQPLQKRAVATAPAMKDERRSAGIGTRLKLRGRGCVQGGRRVMVAVGSRVLRCREPLHRRAGRA